MVTSLVKRILAPVDLAESREPDLSYAISLAAQLRAELLLLAVIDTPATLNLIGHHGAAGGGRSFEQELQEEVKAKLQRVVDQAAAGDRCDRWIKPAPHVSSRITEGQTTT